MRGKSSTCRQALINMKVSDSGGSQTLSKKMALARASPRLAAHQRGKAIGSVSPTI
jgi:hypothetical protein